MKKSKTDVNFKKLLSRQDYLVVQANDLAKAFGNLSAFEHKVLDYCFSFVKKDSKKDDEYFADAGDIIHHLGLTTSGTNYERVVRAFKELNENTALYFQVEEDGEPTILMTQLFGYIKILKNRKIKFKFSDEAAPYVFELRQQYYSFRLSELSQIKSKYSLIMMKLWEANRLGKADVTTIYGKLNEWESWFLGEAEQWTAGRFKDKVLNVAISELEKRTGALFNLNTLKQGRVVVGYELTINSKK